MLTLSSQLRRAHTRAHSLTSGRLAPIGLTPARLDLLYAVHSSTGVPCQADLHRALGVTAVTVSRMLARLEELGLVERAPAADQRAKEVRLTAEGALRVGHALRAIDGPTRLGVAPL